MFDPFDAPPGSELLGYRLEKPLVAESNSDLTADPDDVVGVGSNVPAEWSSGGIFDADDNDLDRRKEYLVRTVPSLSSPDRQLLEDVIFEWTVNEGEGESRQEYFGYDASSRRWDLLPGRSPSDAGTVGSGTAFLRPVPVESLFSVGGHRENVPWRVSIGSPSSLTGHERSVVMVDSFGSPAPGTVECERSTGELNFEASDLSTYSSESVYYQRQRFFSLDDRREAVGLLSNSPPLVLNPIPPSGSSPRIRVGLREEYLTSVEEASEPLTPPFSGSVAWAADTGVLLFSSSDVSTYDGEYVYYDGVVLETDLSLDASAFGTIGSPSSFGGPPPSGEHHVFFFDPGGGEKVAFRTVLKPYESQTSSPGGPFLDSDVLDEADAIPVDEVQVAGDTGVVRVSSSAVERYGASVVLYELNPDLSMSHSATDHGWQPRFFPCPYDLTREGGLGDVQVRTSLAGEVLADRLTASDRLFLSFVPEQDTLNVLVEQNAGSFVGDLPPHDSISPSFEGLVHVLDPIERTLRFGDRKIISGLESRSDRSITLPDRFLVDGTVALTLDGSPLVNGDEALVDLVSGQITLVETFGRVLTEGFRGETTALDTFEDATKDFSSDGVSVGDRLIITSGSPSLLGSYVVSGVGTTELTVEATGERAVPFASLEPDIGYEVRSSPSVIVSNMFDPVTVQDPFARVYRVPVSGPEELLEYGADYSLGAPLGSVQLVLPLLDGESLRAVYSKANSDGSEGDSYDEIVAIRIVETIGPYSAVSHTIEFNSSGRTTVSELGVKLDVGGRPVRSNRFDVDWTSNRVRITSPTESEFVHPNEEHLLSGPIRLSYYVEEASGGEVSFRLRNYPVYWPPYLISDQATELVVVGDQTGSFVTGRLVRVGTELALVDSSSYDASSDLTTVSLQGSLLSRQRNPTVWVSRFAVPFEPLGGYDDVPVGSLLIKFIGDLTGLLSAGTVVRFGPYVHALATVRLSGGDTEVRLRTKTRTTLSSGTYPAYLATEEVLEVGTRVIPLNDGSPVLNPALDRHLSVRLRRPPSPGTELEKDVDYTVSAGSVTLASGIESGDNLDVDYTALAFREGSVDASYVRYVVPTDDNGLLGQRLVVDAVLRTPDTWFARVEPVARFVSETLSELGSSSGLSSAFGVIVPSVPSLRNYERGRRSLIFERGKAVDDDFAGRRMLSFVDEAARDLEGVLRWLTGHVPGCVSVDDPGIPTQRRDGPFRFFVQESDETADGWVDPYDPFSASRYDDPLDPARANDVDDVVKVDEAPFALSGSSTPLTMTSIGTYASAWERHEFSRTYPTHRNVTTRTFDGGSSVGDPVAILPTPEDLPRVKLLTYRSSAVMAMNDLSVRLTHDLGLAAEDQLSDLPLVAARSVFFQVVDPDPDPDTSTVSVDLRAVGDLDDSLGWRMLPSSYRPHIDDFDSVQGLHCDVYRRGSASPVYSDVTVSFVSAAGSTAVVDTAVKLDDLEEGDVFYVASATPPSSYQEGASYFLDRPSHRLTNNNGVGVGPALPPSDGASPPLEVEGPCGLVRTGTRPLRIPCVFALPYDDDWNQTPPLVHLDSEPAILRDDDATLRIVRDGTTRGFSGLDGEITSPVSLSVTVPIPEADGEDFSDSPVVESLDMVRISDDPNFPSNEGSFLVESSTASTLDVYAFPWQESAPVTYRAIVRNGTCDTASGPNVLEDLSASFLSLFFGVALPDPVILVTLGGGYGDDGSYQFTVLDDTHLAVSGALVTASGRPYEIELTSTALVGADLRTLTDSNPGIPDLSGVGSSVQPVSVSASSRSDGDYQPVSSGASSITVGPWQYPSSGVAWYVKRGRALLSSTGEIVGSDSFLVPVATVTGTLTGSNFVVTVGSIGDSQVGDVVVFSSPSARALITSILAGPTLVLSFTTAAPPDSPPDYAVTVYRNFEVPLVGGSHPSRDTVRTGDVLVLTDQTQLDFGRYVVSGISEEVLTVTRETDLSSGFYSLVFPVTGLPFRLDDCRRDELNQADSVVGSWRAALVRLQDVYSDTSEIPEIGFSYLNHADNSTSFVSRAIDLSSPVAADPNADLTDSVTVVGSVDFEAAGVSVGDVVLVEPSSPGDPNHGYYFVSGVSGATLTIDDSVGPSFYVSHVVAAKRPSFSSVPASGVSLQVLRSFGWVSSFALVAMLQEKDHADRWDPVIVDLVDVSTHQSPPKIYHGDVSNARLDGHLGPDLSSQYVTNVSDRLDRVRDSLSPVLYEDVYRILVTEDGICEKRYLWLAFRTETGAGTLPTVKRFDDEIERSRRLASESSALTG